MKFTISAALVCLCFAWIGLANAAEDSALAEAIASIRVPDIKQHVQVLADDSFEGREAGSRGGHAIGVYLNQQFQKAGLKPAGTAGFFQAFGAGYRNILGRIEGSDPKLEDEVVIVSAHYDHVGYGTSQNSLGPVGYIHNGADDNASGVAGLLEVAEAMVSLPQRPRRSVLFVLWDGEEKGLLGSRHWLDHPTVPLKQVSVMLNLDMIGRLRKSRVEIYGARTSYGLRQLTSRSNEGLGLQLHFDWELKENSDHYAFYSAGLPVLMLHTGLHDNYHRPSDDAELVNADGVRSVSTLVLRLVLELANADRRQQFRSAAQSENPSTQRSVEYVLSPPPGRLGVRWEPAADATGGLPILSVVPGSAAERAGLKGGDRILEFAGQTITNGEELRSVVVSAGSPTEAKILQRGKTEPTAIQVALDGRPTKVGISWRTDNAEPGTIILTRVLPGSPAAKAGLRAHDRIYEVGRQKFSDDREFLRMVQAAEPLEFLIERAGQLQVVDLSGTSKK